MQHTIHAESLVARTARALSQISLDSADGEFLGAEDELLIRLGVSRPTLRQAAKIAENDRMISVRRGIRGGFYASRPDADDAIRTLARFLRLRGATLSDIMTVSRRISEEAAALASACQDAGLRARLEEFMARIDQNDTPATVIAADSELARLVAAMSGNPVIELVMAIGYSFGMEEQGIALFRDPQHRATCRKQQHDLCRALLDRDADIAQLMMKRRSDTVSEWIRQAAGEKT